MSYPLLMTVEEDTPTCLRACSHTSELEFLDINLIKDSSLLLHAFHLRADLMKQNSSLVLKILTKKSANQENLSLFMNSIFVERKNKGRKKDKNSEKTRVYAQKP
jgi:hypothetical protein